MADTVWERGGRKTDKAVNSQIKRFRVKTEEEKKDTKRNKNITFSVSQIYP